MGALKKYWFQIVISCLIATRLFHFPSEIDDPHTWRQSDTAQYIESFDNEGINILKPSVNWMGGHKTLLLEFPLPEALIATLYNLFGNHLWISRLFFLLFFVVSVGYLYKILKLFFKDNVPEIATIIFCSLPLSLFYSRAIHIDFFALAFSHGMLYYYLKALLHQKQKYWLVGTLCAVIAFLVKVPYAFYLAFPLIYIASTQKKWIYLLKNSWWTIFPIVALFIWNNYTKSTNSLAPDWDFIPNYNKFTEMWYWYFGTLHQRTLPELWLKIGTRILNEVSGYIGLILTLVGLFFYKKDKNFHFSLFWLIGSIIYLIIFYNLNVVHNYYQIPFLVPVAIFIAMGVSSITIKKWISSKIKPLLIITITLTVIIESYIYAEKNYYEIKYDQIDIGKAIREHSKKDDLVIITYGGLTPQCPNILYQSERYGWSIPNYSANAKLYYTLYHKAGATKLAIIQPDELGGELKHFFDAAKNQQVIELKKHNLKVYLTDLFFVKPE